MNKFMSRKFAITFIAVAGTVVLAYIGKMTGDVSLVLAASIASYNYAQGKIDEKSND